MDRLDPVCRRPLRFPRGVKAGGSAVHGSTRSAACPPQAGMTVHRTVICSRLTLHFAAGESSGRGESATLRVNSVLLHYLAPGALRFLLRASWEGDKASSIEEGDR
jgi:hypothetical protein